MVRRSFYSLIHSDLYCFDNAMDLLNRVCIISGIRLRTLNDARDSDFSYGLSIPHIWSMLEPTLAICAASLPMARPVFSRVLPTSLSYLRHGFSFKSKSTESFGSAKDAAARRLGEDEIPLRDMTRIQVNAGKELGDDSDTLPSRQAVQRKLEETRVKREWNV